MGKDIQKKIIKNEKINNINKKLWIFKNQF
jgi:hypothetical protein